MIDAHSPFGHDFFKVPVRDGVTDMEEHGERMISFGNWAPLNKIIACPPEPLNQTDDRQPIARRASTHKACDRTFVKQCPLTLPRFVQKSLHTAVHVASKNSQEKQFFFGQFKFRS